VSPPRKLDRLLRNRVRVSPGVNPGVNPTGFKSD